MENRHINLKYIIDRVNSQKYPIRFLLSRILWYSKLCKIFVAGLSYGVRIRFYPTSVSAALWTDPNCFDSEGSEFIWNYLLDGDTFIDIGANIGHLTLIGAKKVGQGQVVSIEPHPMIFRFLNNNVKLNKFKNVKTYNLALGDKNGKLYFSDVKSDDQNFITEDGSIKVNIRRLDDLFNGNRVELLKIDTEGYELFVLNGALNTLSKTATIFFESYEANFKRYNYLTKDILNLLMRQNFKIFKFVAGNKLEEIDCDYISEKCENLVAIKDINFFQQRLKNFTLTRS